MPTSTASMLSSSPEECVPSPSGTSNRWGEGRLRIFRSGRGCFFFLPNRLVMVVLVMAMVMLLKVVVMIMFVIMFIIMVVVVMVAPASASDFVERR